MSPPTGFVHLMITARRSIPDSLLVWGLLAVLTAATAGAQSPAPAAAVLASRLAGVSSVTGVPRYVESGLVVGLELKGGRPEIVVNLPAPRTEGADLGSPVA